VSWPALPAWPIGERAPQALAVEGGLPHKLLAHEAVESRWERITSGAPKE
jgi:hypothetical protein